MSIESSITEAAAVPPSKESKRNLHQLLIVDDDLRLRELLSRYLDDQGFSTFAVDGGKAMDSILATQTFDAIILDLMMPEEDGLSICRRLRSSNNTTPIIMLTAKADDIDRIIGLEMGADDYISKPFNPRELVARINAILRRSGEGRETPSDTTLKFGDGFELNLLRRQLTHKGEAISLTTTEFAILAILVKNASSTMPREAIMQAIHGREPDTLTRTLDVQISRLRRLIEPNPADPIYIRTIWGVGYLFVANP